MDDLKKYSWKKTGSGWSGQKIVKSIVFSKNRVMHMAFSHLLNDKKMQNESITISRRKSSHIKRYLILCTILIRYREIVIIGNDYSSHPHNQSITLLLLKMSMSLTYTVMPISNDEYYIDLFKNSFFNMHTSIAPQKCL